MTGDEVRWRPVSTCCQGELGLDSNTADGWYRCLTCRQLCGAILARVRELAP